MVEMEFFRTVAQRVAENLLHHVDGRIIRKRSDATPDVDHCLASEPKNVDLSAYNFPADYQYTANDERKADFLRDCNLKGNCERTLNPIVDKFREYHFKNDSVYMCCVCGDSFSSVHEFDEHELNNHPNVVCSYLEVDFVRNIPIHLLSWRYNSPNGVLRRCVVPPSLNNISNDSSTFKCTKCNQCFPVVGQLHQHIVDCASFTSTQQTIEDQASQDDNIKYPSYNTRSSGKRKCNASRKVKASTKLSRSRRNSEKCDVAVQVCIANRVADRIEFGSNGENAAECVENNTSSSTPKRYSCTKCTKKFMFLNTLKKHQMSCSKVLFRGRKPKAFKSLINRFRNKKKDIGKRFKIYHGKGKFAKSIRNARKETSKMSIASHASTTDIRANVVKSLASVEHRCPRCSRVFTYLANFKKHIKKNCTGKTSTESMCNKSSDEMYAESTISEKLSDGNVTENEDDEATETKVPFSEGEQQNYTFLESNCLNVSTKDNSKLDLWRIKQEHPLYAFKGSPAQHHSCPYCQRGFTYLANYRKHINGICPIRQQMEKPKSSDVRDTSSVAQNKENDKDNDSSSNVSTILRDQTKQNEMNNNQETIKAKANVNGETGDNKCVFDAPTVEVKENSAVNDDNDGQKFRTFSCNICHRIYLSHVKMLRHMLSHKLAEGSSNTQSEVIADTTQEKTMAKQALQRHANESDKRRRIHSSKVRRAQQDDIPCANLLEDLARGGSKENHNSHLTEDRENQNLSHSNLSLASENSANDCCDNEESLENDCKYAIVIEEHTEGNDLSSLEPEICLDDQLTRLVVDAEPDSVEDVVLKLNTSNGENGEVWISFTANETENNDQSAYFQLSRSVSY